MTYADGAGELTAKLLKLGYGQNAVADPWRTILRINHIYRLHKPADEFNSTTKHVTYELKNLFLNKNYVSVLGFIQFCIRQGAPSEFATNTASTSV